MHDNQKGPRPCYPWLRLRSCVYLAVGQWHWPITRPSPGRVPTFKRRWQISYEVL